ncbi:MAG: EamA family transporter [Bacteroidetes bacterium]|nr:EamA family transporter [Bacteroidota bacterium]MBI3483270.1 EamA family transporter [Bacteroidota bacterium]
MDIKKHYASAVAAFLVWGFFPLVLRSINTHPAGEILYFRILFSLLLLVAILLGFMRDRTKENLARLKSLAPQARRTVVALTLSGGALLTINWLVFIYVVNEVNIKTASFSYLICPVVTAVLGYVLLKEKMVFVQWLAIVLCAISCVLMGINNISELGYSLLIAFSYALYLISQRKNQGFNRMIVLGIQVFFAFFIMNIFFGQLVGEIVIDIRFYVITLCVAIVFTVLPLFLNLYALNKINAATIGILMYINPLINFIIAFLVFNEGASAIQIVGYGIIAIALVLFNYPVLKRNSAIVRI